MNRNVWNEFVRRFLDSRAPFYFLVGSLVLAVFGNAVYDGLVYLLGGQPVTLLGIAITTLLLLIALVMSFRAAFGAVMRSPSTRIRSDEPVAPHQGMILLVSLNPNATETAAIHHHAHNETLKHCWLITSPEVARRRKGSDLQQMILEANAEPHLVMTADANQTRTTYEAIHVALKQATTHLGEHPHVIVDITGGTKPMSAGAALACRDLGLPIQYMLTPRDNTGNPSGVPIPVQVRLVDPVVQEAATP